MRAKGADLGMQGIENSYFLELLNKSHKAFHTEIEKYVLSLPNASDAQKLNNYLCEFCNKLLLRFENNLFLSSSDLEVLKQDFRSQASTVKPSQNVYIKGIPATERSYFCSFFDELLHNITFPKRLGPKGRYTLNGNRIFSRVEHPEIPLKKPQYQPHEKKGYSNIQSTSFVLVDENIHLPLYGYCKTLVGCMFMPEDVLLSERHFLIDVHSQERPYDHNYFESIKQYQQDQQHRFYTKASYPEFRKAIVANKEQGRHNESMVRLRWSKSSRIFIGSDLLDSRLLAKGYATCLESKLDHPVQVCFYIPENPELTFKSYTKSQYALDCLEARYIHASPALKKECYAKKSFGFLFGLSTEVLANEFQAIAPNGLPLALYMLHEGYVDIFRVLAENARLSLRLLLQGWNSMNTATGIHICVQVIRCRAQELYQILLPFLTGLKEKSEKITDIFFEMIKKNDKTWISTLFSLSCLDWNAVDKQGSSILSCLAAMGNLEHLQMLLQKRVDINQKNYEGQTPLLLACQHGHHEVARVLIQEGADRSIACNEGKTFYDLALEHQDFKMLELYTKYSCV